MSRIVSSSVAQCNDYGYCETMPTTNEAAALELEQMRVARDLSRGWIARKLGKNSMWVNRRLTGKVSLSVEDYGQIRAVIASVAVYPPETN